MGALSGLRVVEMAGIGPAPFTGMMLADHGAEVLRIDRVEPAGLGIAETDPRRDPLGRGKRSVALDLRRPEGAAAALDLIARADAVIEGFRPGVMERLGLGPDACLQRNPRLVYGRMTGYGQHGPLAPLAGHDIDYIAIAGALGAIGPKDGKPVPPLNLVGDFGGGGMMLAFGVVAALLQVARGGPGQVVDAAMTDGAALLTAMFHGLAAMGLWTGTRGANLLDGGAPFYDTYETADGGYLAVGAIEPKFYAALVEGLGLAGADLPAQMDRANWPRLKARIAAAIRGRTRAAWEAVFAGSDACVAPILSMDEAARHPHNRARATFVEAFGLTQPAPAPRIGPAPPPSPGAPPMPGADTRQALADWGFPVAAVDRLIAEGIAGTRK
ncbi:MAG: CoA transferase [Alphaproteobacteria bacterium]|nr:CoA transferase [Alphaproteobacteria bacterium]